MSQSSQNETLANIKTNISCNTTKITSPTLGKHEKSATNKVFTAIFAHQISFLVHVFNFRHCKSLLPQPGKREVKESHWVREHASFITGSITGKGKQIQALIDKPQSYSKQI